jgi:hypothetical protein
MDDENSIVKPWADRTAPSAHGYGGGEGEGAGEQPEEPVAPVSPD